jgi:hypothetical protein
VAGYPSTVYRLDDAGEVHEVVVEDGDTAMLYADSGPVGTMWPVVDQSWKGDAWDEIAWWARQLGRPLDAD